MCCAVRQSGSGAGKGGFGVSVGSVLQRKGSVYRAGHGLCFGVVSARSVLFLYVGVCDWSMHMIWVLCVNYCFHDCAFPPCTLRKNENGAKITHDSVAETANTIFVMD